MSDDLLEELAALSGDIHRLQSDIASDSVLFVYHRRARIQVLQIAQDCLRVGRGALTAPLLPRACAEELCLRDDGYWRLREIQTLKIGGDGQRKNRGAACEFIPARYRRCAIVLGAQHLVQHFAPTG